MSDKPVTKDAPATGIPDPVAKWTQIIQIPILIGLSIAMLLFIVTFFLDIYWSVVNFEFFDRKKTILMMLNLLDMVFIANLVVMVANNAYSTYLRMRSKAAGDAEEWNERAYRRMKHRIVSTIVIISAIHLLHEFLEFSQKTWIEAAALFGFHMALLATYMVTNVAKSND